MTQRCRLLARAQMSGEVREPGWEFELQDGEIGPHRNVVEQLETIDVKHDSAHVHAKYADEPLYEVFVDGQWKRPWGAK